MSQVLVKKNSLNILKLCKHSRIFSPASFYPIQAISANNSTSNQVHFLNTLPTKVPFQLGALLVSQKNLKTHTLNLWSNQRSNFHSTSILREKKDDEPKDNEQPVENQNQDPPNLLPIPSLVALAPLQVPEFLPKVPLVAVARNPLFPNFIKMLEISDKSLMDLIRRKVHLNQPYIGLFMRKEDKDDDIVKSLDEVYSVGTFTQIREIQDLGEKLRMVVMGVRRIKLNGVAFDDLSPIQPEDGSQIEEKILKNGLRRRLKRNVTKIEEGETKPENITPESTSEGTIIGSIGVESKQIDQVLMIDTANLVHHDFKQTQEIKGKKYQL
ncbi:lon protease mitochondrial isoform X2 [Brachionus plicatilis]|uniref:Lon protease mitochondrial isoform X2 n=1 Tax=Brachionus plicatilis TaxID=10195 RepID=A0A3M7QG85_BRAPC|nr:lon protease mitochondrial isoform X2 [Brachionus plicatilis]